MAQLSEETLEAGRDLIRAKDLDGFMKWVNDNGVVVNRNIMRDTYSKIFRADDVEKALFMFEKVFPGMDPAADLAVAVGSIVLKIAGAALIGLGALGGLVYLIKVLL